MVGVELSKFPHINTTNEFMAKLMSEESVFILCGEVSEWFCERMSLYAWSFCSVFLVQAL